MIKVIKLNVSERVRILAAGVRSKSAIAYELRVPNANTAAAIAELESPESRSKLNRYKNLDTMHESIQKN